MLRIIILVSFLQTALGTTCTNTTATIGPCLPAYDGASCASGLGICATTSNGLECCPIALVSSTTTSTTTTSCYDRLNPLTGVSDCPSRAAIGYCTRSYYVTLMRQQCPVSCGYCSSTATTTSSSSNSTCADLVNSSSGVSDCTSLSYLCTNSVYSALMAVQCRATCGYCSGKK